MHSLSTHQPILIFYQPFRGGSAFFPWGLIWIEPPLQGRCEEGTCGGPRIDTPTLFFLATLNRTEWFDNRLTVNFFVHSPSTLPRRAIASAIDYETATKRWREHARESPWQFFRLAASPPARRLSSRDCLWYKIRNLVAMFARRSVDRPEWRTNSR